MVRWVMAAGLLAGCGRIAFEPEGDGAIVGRDPYAVAVLADAPVGFWRLGETAGSVARDELGQHPGTYQGACQLAVAGAVAGDSAVLFDGSSCRVDVGDAFPFAGQDPFTLEVWMRPTFADGSTRFVIHRGGALTTGYYIAFQVDHVWFEREIDGSAVGYMEVGAPVLTGPFQLYTVTFDGTTQRFYVDGAERANQSFSSVSPVRSGSLAFGDHATSQLNKFEGVLDEIAIYDVALDPARVAAHHAAR